MINIKPPDGYPPPQGKPIRLADETRRREMNLATMRARMARNDGPPAFRPGGNGPWFTFENWFETWLLRGGVVGVKPDAKPKNRETLSI